MCTTRTSIGRKPQTGRCLRWLNALGCSRTRVHDRTARISSLPAEARLANDGFLWAVDRIFGPDTTGRVGPDGAVTGIAASPGSYTGPVRVIMNETEFGRLRAGDVLVCPVTSPVWSVLFPSIGALVTDVGGNLSHPTIIAREYGVPACDR
jgi:rifampicin phosphotransferase